MAAEKRKAGGGKMTGARARTYAHVRVYYVSRRTLLAPLSPTNRHHSSARHRVPVPSTPPTKTPTVFRVSRHRRRRRRNSTIAETGLAAAAAAESLASAARW